MTSSLYQRDFLLWTLDTVDKLKTHDFDQLDLENLIEEIESLGRSEKKELKSRLLILLEHLLKRLFLNSPNDYRSWEITIDEQRRQIELELEDSPSLKTIWEEAFSSAWRLALKGVRKNYSQVTFPDVWPYPNDIDSILDCDFWKL
ncbi:DUF29 domain-containing protein [Anabaena sp. UHCC 0451]|uniref:DUF29 domain-containing protein n=1 Tax=Anabaena sp. UHCC 0451 TaxID=2055235 RepID=UPI002B218EDA|nr:DUF29 domain-containing protein [Anabaena sp. UHCC 0451]MEA5576583.1 DUF29 domain-containing protein [Anabaena sp. UHCC 0451]